MNTNLSHANSSALAQYLRQHSMPGARSKTAIAALRRSRAKAAQPVLPQPNVRERLDAHTIAQFKEEAQTRQVFASITDKQGRSAPYTVLDRRVVDGYRVVLIETRGWMYYSSRHPYRYQVMQWLYGTDDAGEWARRVPATAQTVTEAIATITPATVTKALSAGRRVKRQGDVYAIETTPAHDGSGAEDLPGSHLWNPATRYLTHNPADGRKHRPVKVGFPARFVRQLHGAVTFTTD